MKFFYWNVHGLGSPLAIRKLRHMSRFNKPRMVFLKETKLDKRRIKAVRRRYGFTNGFKVSFEGSKGGLSLHGKMMYKLI